MKARLDAPGAAVRPHVVAYPEITADGHSPLPPCRPPMMGIYARTNPQVKSHQHVKLANSIVDSLPPEEIPRVRVSLTSLRNPAALTRIYGIFTAWSCFPSGS